MKSNYNTLYILSCHDGKFVKIGICKENNIQRRIKNLQTGNPYPIKIEWVEEREVSNKAEKYLHQCFSDKRVHGEWFEGLTVRDIRAKLMMFHDQK